MENPLSYIDPLAWELSERIPDGLWARMGDAARSIANQQSQEKLKQWLESGAFGPKWARSAWLRCGVKASGPPLVVSQDVDAITVASSWRSPSGARHFSLRRHGGGYAEPGLDASVVAVLLGPLCLAESSMPGLVCASENELFELMTWAGARQRASKALAGLLALPEGIHAPPEWSSDLERSLLEEDILAPVAASLSGSRGLRL